MTISQSRPMIVAHNQVGDITLLTKDDNKSIYFQATDGSGLTVVLHSNDEQSLDGEWDTELLKNKRAKITIEIEP